MASTTARQCSTMTVAAMTTSISGPRSKSATATSSSTSRIRTRKSRVLSTPLSEHALGGGRGSLLPDRPGHAKKRRHLSPDHSHRQTRTVVWANPGMPVTLATNHCGQEIMEAIVKALAPACPDRAMAGWGRRFRIAIQGRDPRARVSAKSGSEQLTSEAGQAPHPSLSPHRGKRIQEGRRGAAEPYPKLGEGANSSRKPH